VGYQWSTLSQECVGRCVVEEKRYWIVLFGMRLNFLLVSREDHGAGGASFGESQRADGEMKLVIKKL